jgi:DnaB-like helicase C terminal domain
MSKELSPLTILDQAKVTEITNTRERSFANGVSQRIKNGQSTPEEELARAEAEMAKPKFAIPPVEARQFNYDRACQDRALSEANKQPFIYPGFSESGDFYLSRGMTLVGACSGGSKSTTAANILAGFITYDPNSLAVVISNEESTDAILHRTACVLLRKPYMAFHKGELSPKDTQAIRDCAFSLIRRIVVVSAQGWDTTCLEDVTDILESCIPQAVSMVLIDYYQTICHSRDKPDLEHFAVLKEFGKFIREYGRNAPIPVVVFCQLSPKSHAPEFQSRVQYDKTIYNDAFNVVEIEPDFATRITKFTICKQRFGVSQGTAVELLFESGRYVPKTTGGGL